MGAKTNMKARANQNGFTIIYVALVVIVAGTIGLVGWRVLSTQKTIDKLNTPVNSDQKPAAKPAANLTAEQIQPITNKNELDKAKSNLDLSNLDGDLNESSLDQDINSLL